MIHKKDIFCYCLNENTYAMTPLLVVCYCATNIKSLLKSFCAQLAGAVKYTDCTSAEG